MQLSRSAGGVSLAELCDSGTFTKRTRLAGRHWQTFRQESQVATPVQETVTAWNCERERCSRLPALE